MFFGAGVVMAVVSAAILVAAPYARAGDLWGGIAAALEIVSVALLAGIMSLVGGRVLYGHWRMGAPMAAFTGNIARTMGLVSAVVLGGTLVMMVAMGLKYEDTLAAVALALGALLGVMVAQLGSTLRDRGYPD
jgi:hypothetical protein